jgi:hypothetical protein
MFDPEHEQEPTRRDRLVALGLAGAVMAAVGADLFAGYEPAKLSVPFMLLAWAPLLVMHESAHAVAARYVGWRLDEVVIGYGRQVARRVVLGVPVELRTLPIEGFVRCTPRDAAGVRWKSAWIYFAGPGSQLGLALGILALAGSDVLLTRAQEVPVIALQSIALASALSGVLNLMPHSTFGPSGEMPSDGLGILQSLTRPHSDWERELKRRRLRGED